MTLEQIIQKFRDYPMYIGTGAGKLARQWNTTQETVQEARDFILGKSSVKTEDGVLPKILIFDLETAPMQAFVWSRWKQNVYLEQTISEFFILTWAAKWLFDDNVISARLTKEEVLNEDDGRIMTKLWKLVDEADILIAHNGDYFDVPRMNAGFIKNGLMPPSPYKQIDTKKIAAKEFGFSSNKLDALAGYFDIDHKIHTGFDLWKKCMKGDEEALEYMETYNKKDVEILEEVYLKLRPWIKGHPSLALYGDLETNKCTHCGSTNFRLLKDKFYRTNVSKFPIYRCNTCGAIMRDRTSLKDKPSITCIPK